MAKPSRHQRAGAVEFLLRELDLGLLLFEVRLGLVERPLRLADQRLGFFQRSLQILRVHDRDDLAGADHVAFIDKELGDAAGEFRVDVDRVGFKTAVAPGDARRQAGMRLTPPIKAGAAGGCEEDERQNEDRWLAPAAGTRRRLRQNSGQIAGRGSGIASAFGRFSLLRLAFVHRRVRD